VSNVEQVLMVLILIVVVLAVARRI
jgi:hypothetical protein